MNSFIRLKNILKVKVWSITKTNNKNLNQVIWFIGMGFLMLNIVYGGLGLFWWIGVILVAYPFFKGGLS